MSDIKPIETRYKGYRFRSRLEARWAVFFDAAGIGWQYETEGFDLGNGTTYLPDFWIKHVNFVEPYPEGNPPEQGMWLEIKGAEPTETEHDKCRQLSRVTGHCVYLVHGDPMDHVTWKFHPRAGGPFFDDRNPAANHPAEHNVLEHYLAVDARPDAFNYDFGEAQTAARSARFEHGERG